MAHSRTFQRANPPSALIQKLVERRGRPILAMIPPPAQYAVTFLAGLCVDRFMPWKPGWLTMEGAAVAFAGFILALVSAG
jgi:hypothetical protein